ncbi:MAG: hypothetical protein HQ559_14320, partial [Lentisphaerae bacterium]|nr:hypothetical protein [Lentisphaerota bacterium]
YSYVKERYLFVVDLFTVPVMAMGVLTLLDIGARVSTKLTKRDTSPLRDFSVRIATVVLLLVLVADARDKSPRLKVWHVDDMREAILPRLKHPAVIVAKSRRLSRMLQWLLGIEGKPKKFGTTVSERTVRDYGVQAALSEAGQACLAEIRSGNFYSCGMIELLRNWVDFERVMSLTDVPVPIEQYRRRIKKDIYHLRPWSRTNIVRDVSFEPGSENYLLMANCFRIWDYPDRTYCDLYVGEQRMDVQLTNGMNFVEVDASLVEPDGATLVRVVSDGPLPAKPVFRTMPLNGALNLPLGAQPEYSLDAYISKKLRFVKPNRSDACMLFGTGTVTLPRFAAKGKTVVAEFRVNDYREEPSYRGEHFLSMDAGHGSATHLLPGRRGAMWAFVILGPGTGRLEFSNVELSTTFPSRFQQASLKREKHFLSSFVYLKLTEVRIRVLSAKTGDSLVVDVGGPEDVLYLRRGFFARERASANRTVRWTGGSARVGLPVPVPPGGVRVSVECLVARPENSRETPRFRVDGTEIDPSLVTTEPGADDTVSYSFRVARNDADEQGEIMLDMETTPWTPASSGRDTRKLGVMVDRIVVEPASADPSS